MPAELQIALSLVAALRAHDVFASPLSRWADACQVPNWSVQDVSITYSDDSNIPGLASFSITNSLTHQHESLQCELLFNTLCRVEGTPLDKNLSIYLQVNLWVGLIQFNQTWACQTGVAPNPSPPSFVDASAEFEVDCPEVITNTMTCTALLNNPLLVNGTIVTPVPDPMVKDGGRILAKE